MSDLQWVYDNIIHTFTNISIINIFAFNGTWKTRLSQKFENQNSTEEENVLQKTFCYNAYFEDLFTWNNEDLVLQFGENWIFWFIRDQGLDQQIIDNFKNFWNTKIEPDIDLDHNTITFTLPTWDDEAQRNIKISRAEETNFIWTVFYTVLEAITDSIHERSTDFSELEYIIIDDPISSIDDGRVIALSVKLMELFEKIKSLDLKIAIFTHHSLFYSVLFHKLEKKTTEHYVLLNNSAWWVILKKQKGDSPFWYHLLIKRELDAVVASGNIERRHFNLLRTLLEKTANFLWLKKWQYCLDSEEFAQLVNIYSHNRLDNFDSNELPQNEKDLFRSEFYTFIKKFNFT